MKTLYITQFYSPENIAGAFRAFDNTQNWVDLGDSIYVYTAYPNYPIGRIFDGYTNDLFCVEQHEKISVMRNKISVKPNTSIVNRVINGCSFYYYGRLNSKNLVSKEIDTVFASSGPIFTGYLGYYLSKKLKRPFVIEFRDIAFEQMVATGTNRNSWKVRLMRRLELRLCKKASQIVVLTKGFKDILIANGISPTKISVIPNGADIVPTVHIKHSGLNLGYFGTMGISQDVCRTLELVNKIKSLVSDLHYELIGEGAVRQDVEKWMINNKDSSYKLMHGMPLAELEQHYAKTDLCVVSLQDSDSFSATIPSKIFQSFARGVPVLFIGPEGEAADIIRKADAGIVLTGDDASITGILAGFFKTGDWRTRIVEMSNNARKVMETEYSRTYLSGKLRDVLVNVDNGSRKRTDD